MGYLFLFVALVCGAVKGFCGKKMSGYAENLHSAALINLVRMTVCVLISLCVVILSGNIGSLKVSGSLIATSALAGVSTAAFIIKSSNQHFIKLTCKFIKTKIGHIILGAIPF